MRRGRRICLATVLLFALACCAGSAQDADRTGRLVCAWLMMTDGVDFPGGCFSGLPIQYHAGGTYSAWGEAGRWRIAGGRLVETALSNDPLLVEDSAVDKGRPHVASLRWIGLDRFEKRWPDGHVREFRRCPDRNISGVTSSAGLAGGSGALR